MKRSRILLFALLMGMLLMASFNLAMAYLQDAVPPTVASFSMPLLLWIPFVLGFIGHWYASYVRDKVTINFFAYFGQGVINSITAVVGGFLSFAGLYAGNPEAYPNNFYGWIGVFLISYAWDSLANGTNNSVKVASPTTPG
jgi:hypothetical protein